MKSLFRILLVCLLLFPAVSFAKLTVLTSETNLESVTREIGRNLIVVESVAKGTQDPHYIEAKPSFMVKANKADLFIAVGLGLEVGWLPNILRGARNPKVMPGQPGYLEVGKSVEPLEVPQGEISRADGDVHPEGNPHFLLDPIRTIKVAQVIAERLKELDSKNAGAYTANYEEFKKRLEAKENEWRKRIQQSGVKKVVTFHKTLTYFLNRFDLQNPAILEPKPGIPPTSGHILEVIQIIKTQKVPLILVENYFDSTVTKRIKEAVGTIRVQSVPVAVEGAKGVHNILDLYETLVQSVEGKSL